MLSPYWDKISTEKFPSLALPSSVFVYRRLKTNTRSRTGGVRLQEVPNIVELQSHEGPSDWKSMFTETRIRYIDVDFTIAGALYQGARYINIVV